MAVIPAIVVPKINEAAIFKGMEMTWLYGIFAPSHGIGSGI